MGEGRCSEKLVEVLDTVADEGTSLEMKETSTEYITDVVFFCFFGVSVNKEWLQKNSEIKRIQEAMAVPELTTQVKPNSH